MGWVRIDDGFYDHEKHIKAGPLGIAMWVTAIAWCNRNLTDGRIPRTQVRRLLDWEGVGWRMWSNNMFGAGEDAQADHVAQHLVEVGLFDEAEDGFVIHDYLEYQPLAEAVRIKRAADRDRKASARIPGGVPAESKPSQPQPQSHSDEPLAERLSTGCGFPLRNCERVVKKLRNEGIGDVLIDEAIGRAIKLQASSPGYVLKVARDQFERKTGGAG